MNSTNVKKVMRKKAGVQQDLCVACGACANVCPVGAISVFEGMFAEVNLSKCVGCTKCSKECPASVIDMIAMEMPIIDKKTTEVAV